ncbi:hypothetical protein [Micromonospora sp. NPDC049102]|uniref:hypothetical protein n=1 Tax=Micromonospora sp. NPDC049102 TaxID=3364265 RepID=UPI003712814E
MDMSITLAPCWRHVNKPPDALIDPNPVNAALYSQTSNLRHLGRHLVRRRRLR